MRTSEDFVVNKSDNILVVASSPQDIAVACGGFISKYNTQIDLLCSNKDGKNTELYFSVFNQSMVNKLYIDNAFNYNSSNIFDVSKLDMTLYNIILIPHKYENDSSHQYISNILIKKLLEDQGCKDDLKILRYELWNPIKEADYFENITDYIDKKKKLILSYKKTDAQVFAERVISNNKFRTFTSTLSGQATHVEAFCIDELSAYLEKPDIINNITDKDFKNEIIESYLKENNAQTKINELANRYSGKDVIIYGADKFSRCIFKNYDLSKLNIVAIADKRFEQKRAHEFYGINCIKPQDLLSIKASAILIADLDFVEKYDFLVNKIVKDADIEIVPLIKTSLDNSTTQNCNQKICARPFHVLSIVPTGHCVTCCPAYIKNFTIGNIFNNDLEAVWNSNRARHLRNMLMNNDYTMCDLNTCINMELIDKDKINDYYINKNIKMPDTILMSWDYDCNVACITCRNNLIKNDEKNIENLKGIENSILEACKNAKYFYASGNGDPFGSSYARNIIRKIIEVNPNIKFLIHTNGILCNKKICEELNITDKIKDITFSIHASCKETYDKIVRYGNFEKVIENLAWISKLKKDGIIENIYLVFVVHKLNYKDMPEFVRIAEKYNAVASFRYYRQWANNSEFNYNDMAVFEKNHPEYNSFLKILSNDIFNSKNCFMDPSLRLIQQEAYNMLKA